MKKRIFKLSLKAIVAFSLIGNTQLFSQSNQFDGRYEEVIAQWPKTMMDIRDKLSISNIDFNKFYSFYQQKNDSLQVSFRRKVLAGTITMANVGSYMAFVESQDMFLYKQYLEIKKNYPSSVAEYSGNNSRKPFAICSVGCNNMDFSNGTLSGWNAYYEQNNSEQFPAPPVGYSFTAPVGGAAGAVTRAANDPLTGTGKRPDYQVAIMTNGNDPLIPAVPKVYPLGGSNFSARIGDSTWYNSGVAILNQTFLVTAANTNLTYAYAVFLENSLAHDNFTEAFFNISVLDSVGDTITSCFNYNVVSNNAASKGYDSIPYFNPDNLDTDHVYYKNWQLVSTDLKKYIGHCVTLQFKEADCSPGGHFGYAYVTASCSGYGITTSSPTFCGQKYVTLNAPPGASQYTWTGPTNGIIGASNTQTINIDSAGTYQVIINPVTGSACADTLTLNVPKGPGPVPVPFFKADTACAGNITQFTNLSAPGAGASTSFYWDFYNNGTIEDSTTSPTWLYPSPGVYTVKLFEVHNGCGTDTTIKIMVDTIPSPSFKASNFCSGQAVTFTNTTPGTNTYSWNFGNGSTSTAVSPTNIYAATGTYTVTLYATNASKCIDSVKEVIKINTTPTIKVTATDTTICDGTSTKLTASGAGNYIWQPGGNFGRTITVSPTDTTTYTVVGRQGACSDTVKFTVNVLPIVKLTLIATHDTICQGNSTALSVSGGTSTYTWAPNTALSASTGAGPITATPTTTVTYTVNAAAGTNGCSSKDSTTITVFGPGALAPKVTLSSDSGCPGTNVTLTATGATSFSWGGGATTSSITIAPLNNTTSIVDTIVTVVAHSACRADTTINVKVYIEPVPNPVISGNDSICKGGSTVLTASSTIGTPGYLWLTTTDRTDTLTVAPNTQTIYTVIAANGGCTKQATFTVSIRPVPFVRAVPSQDTICLGTTDTLTGLGASTYTWAPSSSLNSSTGAKVIATPTATTTYTVTGASSAGCTATARVRVTVISTTITTTADSLSRDSLCPGSALTIFETGPYNPGYTYTWSAGASPSVPPNSAIVIPSNVGTTTYTLTISNKCASKQVIATVYVEPRPVITMSASPNPVCSGANVTLTASSNSIFSGILWVNGIPNSHNGTIVVNPTVQTTYTVEAANAYCVASDTLTVGIRPAPNGAITGVNTTCPNQNITLYATGGGLYKWFNGSTADSIVIAPSSAVNAYVLVSNGCTDSVSHLVTIKPAPTIWACCDTTINLGGTASIGVTGGVAWQWEPSSTVANDTVAVTTATPSVNTTYTVILKGANGCTYLDSVIVDIACHDLAVPNVFTPDLAITSTTLNDNVFLIKGVNPGQEYKIEIYNRWGTPVFTSTNPDDPWNGKDKSGTLVSTGVYYYIITSTCGGKNYSSHGYVQVIRQAK